MQEKYANPQPVQYAMLQWSKNWIVWVKTVKVQMTAACAGTVKIAAVEKIQ